MYKINKRNVVRLSFMRNSRKNKKKTKGARDCKCFFSCFWTLSITKLVFHCYDQRSWFDSWFPIVTNIVFFFFWRNVDGKISQHDNDSYLQKRVLRNNIGLGIELLAIYVLFIPKLIIFCSNELVFFNKLSLETVALYRLYIYI